MTAVSGIWNSAATAQTNPFTNTKAMDSTSGSSGSSSSDSSTAGATISANATDDGNGGSIVLWSEKQTNDEAFLSAAGGPRGGDGGFIETSSAGQLNYAGQSILLAPNGRVGTLLLDPENVTIQTTSASPVGLS